MQILDSLLRHRQFKFLSNVWKQRRPKPRGAQVDLPTITNPELLIHLANIYGTPLYVINEPELNRSIKMISDGFSTFPTKVEIAYPYKVNNLKRLCVYMRQHGSWAEISSGLELEMALEVGVDPACIVFNGPNKPDLALEKALSLGCMIHMDNFEEIERVWEISNQLAQPFNKVGLRVSPSSVERWDRFGFLFGEEANCAVRRIIKCPNLKLTSLQTHRSMITDLREYRRTLTQLFTFAAKIIEKYAIPLEYIDIGGGFAYDDPWFKDASNSIVPSITDYVEVIADAWHQARLPSAIKLIVEPGAKAVTPCGSLLARVTSVKTRPYGQVAFIDIGFNILPGVFDQEYTVSTLREKPYRAGLKRYQLSGSLCDSHDIISRDVMPPPLTAGDLLCIANTGGYDYMCSYSWQIARPPVVWVDANLEHEIIRAHESVDYQWQLQR